jgi:hypothetical protein
MAALIVAAAGAAIGGTVISGGILTAAGSLTLGAQIGWAAGSLLGSGLGRKNQTRPQLQDLRVTGTGYGQVVPYMIGSGITGGSLIWASKRRPVANTQRVGKGGGSKVTSYTYRVDLYYRLTENQMDGVAKVFRNGELVWDGTEVKAGVWGEIRVYTGALDEMPDPTYEAAHGPGLTPAHRGGCKVMLEDVALDENGQIPNFTFLTGAMTAVQQDVELHPYTGVYDSVSYTQSIVSGSNQGGFLYDGFGDGPDAGYPPANTILSRAFANDNITITKTLQVQPNRLVTVGVWHNNWLTLNLNGDVFGGVPALTSGFTQFTYTPTTSTLTVSLTVTEWSSANPNKFYAAFRVVQSQLVPNVGYAAEVPIKAAVEALLQRAGYTSDEYDTSDLAADTSVVRWVYISQLSSTRAILEGLAMRHGLTFRKDTKIYVMRRRTAVDKVIPFGQIGWTEEPGGAENPLPIRRGDPEERTAQVFLRYRNVAQDYAPDVAESDRLVGGQQSSTALDMPLGLLPSEAKATADRLLRNQAAELIQYGPLRLSVEHAELVPGDVIQITDDAGDTHIISLRKRTDLGLLLEFEGVSDDLSPIPDQAPVTDDDQGQQVVQQPSASLWLPGDWPLFRDVDDAPGWYALMTSAGDGSYWPGGDLVRSWDDVDYSLLVSFTRSGTFGTCLTTLPDFDGGNCYDEISVLEVQLHAGTLASSTRAAMAADLTINVMMVGSECIRFRRADLVGPLTYRLTGLIRGFRGTEWAMATHEANEVCALIDTAMQNVPTQTSQLNQERYLKGVTSGQAFSAVTPSLFTDTGRRLRPFSVAGLRALATVDGDVLVTWRRRSRLSYSYTGPVVVPLGELVEAYRLRVFDGATLVRTVNLLAPSFTYTAAMAAADGFASLDQATFTVVQLSEIAGEGYPASTQGTIP